MSLPFPLPPSPFPLIDTHCHYNLQPLTNDFENLANQAYEKGVTGSVIIGVNLETSRLAVSQVIANPTEQNLTCAIGTHPTDHSGESIGEIKSQLKRLFDQNQPHISAIGEVGLDFFRLEVSDQVTRDQQVELFTTQIKLANQFNLPLILHVRDQSNNYSQQNNAYYRVRDLIKKHYQFKRPFILHCISGPEDYILEMVDMGGYVGLAANVTYKNSTDLLQILKKVSKDKLLLETDAPFLPPADKRGQVCLPQYLTETGEFVEKEMGADLSQILANTFRIFKFE